MLAASTALTASCGQTITVDEDDNEKEKATEAVTSTDTAAEGSTDAPDEAVDPEYNTTWSYENGVLTIGGTGMMEDYYDEEADDMLERPWEEYVDEITTVIIEDGVTSIGNSAFYWCESLTSVNIPDSVTSIGDNAFYYCDGLSTVTIDNSADAVTIGGIAFPSGCTVTYTK